MDEILSVSDAAWTPMTLGAIVIAGFIFMLIVKGAERLMNNVDLGHGLGDALTGREATVQEWDTQEGRGLVRVHGEVWQASARQGFTPGETVRIKKIQGLQLHVAPNR